MPIDAWRFSALEYVWTRNPVDRACETQKAQSMGLKIGRKIRKFRQMIILSLYHPAAWNDDLARAGIRELSNRYSGKSFAIVGNAQSLFSYPQGAEIDAHDVVVRMGRGFIRDAMYQGKKANLVTMAHTVTDEQIRSGYGDVDVIWTSYRRLRINPQLAFTRRKLYYGPLSIWKDLSYQLEKKGPSTGLYTVSLISELFSAASITLYGFDWMETKSIHKDAHLPQYHEWENERRIIKQWLDADPGSRHLRVPGTPSVR